MSDQKRDNINIDVLIVGGGPVGLFAGLQLCNKGVNPKSIKIIDKRPKQMKWAKASGIQSKSMELFKSISNDLIDNIFNRALKIGSFNVGCYDNDSNDVSIVLKGKLDSEFDYSTFCEQWYTEQCIAKELNDKYGIKLERNIELIDFVDNKKYIKCDILDKNNNTKYNINTKYIIGSDGGRSFIRNKLGISFNGHSYDRGLLIYEGHIDGNKDLVNGLFMKFGKHGFIFSTALPENKVLVVFEISDEQKNAYNDNNGKVKLTENDWNNLFQSRGVNVTVKGEPIWVSYFKLSDKQAGKYSNGDNIFLCGDACHIHSPLGGQGMNMGIQDANNIAWKLSLVLNNISNKSILNSYHVERHSIDKQVLKFVDMQHTNVTSLNDSALKRALTSRLLLPIVTSFPIIVKIIANTIGELSYTYKNVSSNNDDNNLNMEHYIKPPVFFEILKRREQNINRLIRKRLSAGDRMFDFTVYNEVNNEEISLYKSFQNKTFIILFFQGQKKWTQNKYYKTYQELIELKKEFNKEFNGIKHLFDIYIIEYNDNTLSIYQKIGIKGQSLMLIRPDHYIGFKSEPIYVNSLKYYFIKKLGIISLRYHKTLIHLKPDWIPSVLIPTVSLLFASTILYFTNKKWNYIPKIPKIKMSIEWQ